MRFPIVSLFCGFFLISVVYVNPVFAQSDVKKLYKSAEEKYSQGDVDEAISDLEEALKIDANFSKAEELLLKILITVGTEYYAKGNYERAFPYLNKAFSLAPQNQNVKHMYEIVSKEVEIKEREKQIAELEARKKAEEKERQAELEAKKKEEELLETKRLEEEKRERELEAKRRKEEEQRKRADFETKMGREREEMEQALLAKKEEIEKARERYEETRASLKRGVVLGIVGLSLSFLVAVFLIFIIFAHSDRRFERRWKEEHKSQGEFYQKVEKILLGNQERILGLLEKLSSAVRGETKKMIVERPGGGREIITDINPHIRARADGVELIESTIDDPEVGERLLKPFLEDGESRVRANARKALYKFNKEKAMVLLTEMCKSDDQWMRLSGAWALGEIGSPAAAEILLSLLTDPWEFVKNRAAKSLEKILTQRREGIEGSLRERIESTLRKIKKPET